MDTLGRTKESPLLTHFLCQGSHWETVNVERMQHPSCHFVISTMLSLMGFLSHRLVLSLARHGEGRGLGILGYFAAPQGTQGLPGSHRDSESLTQAYLPRNILQPCSLYHPRQAMAAQENVRGSLQRFT